MTYTSPVVAPPAPLPWDLPAITAAALDVLRLDPTDQDADRIATAAMVATADVEAELDYETSPWATAADIPPAVTWVATVRTVEAYRRKDAPFGLADSFSPDGASVYLPANHRRGTSSVLAPYRSRRGVG